MRARIAGIVWLGLVAGATAQQPAPGAPASKSAEPPPAVAKAPEYPELSPKAQQYVDAYLAAWETRMSKVEGLETKIQLTETDGDGKTVFNGDASILRPNYAKMFLRQSDTPANVARWRHFIADGQYLWEYQHKAKKAMVSKLEKDSVGNNTLLSFMFGMKAADMKKRYHISLDPETLDKTNKKYDANYLFLTILPRTREDMQEFAKAELVLWKNNTDPKFADNWMLPARLWFQHTNKNQVMWTFGALSTQKKLLARDFAAPALPDKEWKSEWAVNPNDKRPEPIVRPTAGTGTVK